MTDTPLINAGTEIRASQGAIEMAQDSRPNALAPVDLDQIAHALGEAVARCWSRLPQAVQHDLFEAAVQERGDEARHQLALFLHAKHERTIDAQHSRALPEPDSLGG